MKKDTVTLVTRHKIYNFILENPGTFPGVIGKKLDIPRTTLEYHLRFLEKNDLISFESDGLFHRYYVTEFAGYKNKKILSILRKRTCWEVVLYLLGAGISSQIQLCRELEKNPSTIASSISYLLEQDIIEEMKRSKDNVYETKFKNKIILNTTGREIIYRLKNPREIYDLILVYKKSLSDENSYKNIFIFYNFFESVGTPKTRDYISKVLDNLYENIIQDIFPHPYHC